MSTKNAWTWTAMQVESFNKLKEEISSSQVLALYDTSGRNKISADASVRLIVPHREPLLPTPLPGYPQEHDVADILELKGSIYLLIADYYSRFVECRS